MPDQVRQLHLLVGDVDGGHLLATPDGALPSRVVTLAEGETTVAGAVRVIRDQLDLHVPILEIHFDYGFAHDDRGSGAVPVLVVTEPPAPEWSPSEDLAWRRLADLDPGVASGLRPRLAELLAERRGELPIASLRPRWARTGWHARATGWIFQQLDALGRPPTGPIEQVRHWGISALMRTPTERGRVWFKAVFPLFAQEVPLTALLDRDTPGSVAPVLAHDDAQGWLLMEDIGTAMVAQDPDADASSIDALVALQRRYASATEALTVAGIPTRPLSSLADELQPCLRDELTREWIPLTEARIDALLEAIREAVTTIEALGFPATLVHGDFHPENVVVHGGQPVIFDWSDGAIAHPIMDAVTWVSWLDLEGEHERAERSWQRFLTAWSDVCPVDRADAARSALRLAAAAFHARSYHTIVSHMEPLRRPELADGLVSYIRHLDDAVPR